MRFLLSTFWSTSVDCIEGGPNSDIGATGDRLTAHPGVESRAAWYGPSEGLSAQMGCTRCTRCARRGRRCMSGLSHWPPAVRCAESPGSRRPQPAANEAASKFWEAGWQPRKATQRNAPQSERTRRLPAVARRVERPATSAGEGRRMAGRCEAEEYEKPPRWRRLPGALPGGPATRSRTICFTSPSNGDADSAC